LGVGDTFMVNVTISNVAVPINDGFAGGSWDLSWDPTVLNVVTMTEVLFKTLTAPADYPSNVWNLALKFNNTAGTASYSQTWQDLGLAQTDGYAPANITTPIPMATFIFKIMKAPPFHGSVSTALTLANVKIGNLNGQPINGGVTVTSGLFQLNWAAPTSHPYFTVDPATYTAPNAGYIFNVTVCVNNLTSLWSAVGFEFKLGYNDTILQLMGIFEGPWLPPFGVSPNGGTIFMTNTGPGFVQVGDVVLPDGNGTWHAPFPSASDPNHVPMAIIEFNATMQGLFPTILSSALHLYDTKVGDLTGGAVAVNPSVDGFYSITPQVLGRSIDIFVGQNGTPYPNPYGGQGPNAPADMFWPQKQVCVWAYVTYNQWPEQQKDVAFQIFDPHGTVWGVIYARTNATGYAETCFRLPWPCDNPEYYIGVWTIVGTVDVACQIINDTVQFHYDYLVRIWKITADPNNVYAHNSTVCYDISYGSHAQQTYNVTIAMTGLDETGVPFAFTYKQVQIGGTIFCQPKNFTDTLCIYIPKWARAGAGEVDVAFLDNWPYLGGTVQSGYYDGTHWLGYGYIPIDILAAWA